MWQTNTRGLGNRDERYRPVFRDPIRLTWMGSYPYLSG